MLSITPEAMDVIRRITGHPKLDAGSGLRIGRGANDGPLQVRAAPGPDDGDEVVERDGGRLFLEPGVAEQLEGSDLDVRTAVGGAVQFVVRPAA